MPILIRSNGKGRVALVHRDFSDISGIPAAGAGDEEYARQLQAQFDAENGGGFQRPSDKGGPPAMPAAPPRSYTSPTQSPGQQTASSYAPPSSSYPASYPSTDGPLGQHLATNAADVTRQQGSDQGGRGSSMYPSTQGFGFSNQQSSPTGGAAGLGTAGLDQDRKLPLLLAASVRCTRRANALCSFGLACP